MRSIETGEISRAVAALAVAANRILPAEVAAALAAARETETAALPRQVLEDILANHRIAAEDGLPLCQDTGAAVVFVELGQDLRISGGLLTEAIQQGVRQGYAQGYLRKSMVGALSRLNTNDNSPALIHVQLVAGDQLKITLAPKGGGAENMSRLAMLTPSAGREGVKEFVRETVRLAGPNPCPPVVVGLGLGGNFELAPLLAKKALLRPLASPGATAEDTALARELLAELNALGIGPQGLGGQTTALAVLVESMPCHFATLPVAVNLNCHVARHASVIL